MQVKHPILEELNSYFTEIIQELYQEQEFVLSFQIFDKSRSGIFKVPSKNNAEFYIYETRLNRERSNQQESLLKRIEENIKDEAGNKWYKLNFECNHLQQYQAEFKFIKYPYLNFSDIEIPPSYGSDLIPSFACRYLNRSLLESIPEDQLSLTICKHVLQAISDLQITANSEHTKMFEYAKSISREFYLVYLNSCIEGDINNGRFNQLFRNYNTMGIELIKDNFEALRLLGAQEYYEIFKEAVQLYAHFYESVETLRKTCGFARVEKQTKSDIDSRFYAMKPELTFYRNRYIKENTGFFITEAF